MQGADGAALRLVVRADQASPEPPVITRRCFWPLLSAAAVIASGHGVSAQQTVIVALGASNTEGKGRGRTPGGVSRSDAYPAQLQALLRGRGVSARVINAGIAGDTTGGMLARLDRAVPAGTHVVILQPGGNDARRGEAGDRAGNIAAIQQRLAARGVTVIMLEALGRIAPDHTRDPDGQHFNREGHAAFANHLLPQVLRALGR
jgi:acyl-CoA thioesterase-1